jgi:UDP-N-acetylglucosamine 1-carboxyvinyltransferase
MGANIRVEGNTATIAGGSKITGARLKAVDLRGGAAVLIAALAADGVSEITGTDIIERGYYNIVGKFKALGANISYDVSENPMPTD